MNKFQKILNNAMKKIPGTAAHKDEIVRKQNATKTINQMLLIGMCTDTFIPGRTRDAGTWWYYQTKTVDDLKIAQYIFNKYNVPMQWYETTLANASNPENKNVLRICFDEINKTNPEIHAFIGGITRASDTNINPEWVNSVKMDVMKEMRLANVGITNVRIK